MSNPPSIAPPSVAAVARTTAGVVAHSAGPLGHTHAQGLKRAFEGMLPISVSSIYLLLSYMSTLPVHNSFIHLHLCCET